MEFERIKKRIIQGLIEEITCLDPCDLELIGQNVIAALEGGIHIRHAGMSKSYNPIGYTIDRALRCFKWVNPYPGRRFRDKSC